MIRTPLDDFLDLSAGKGFALDTGVALILAVGRVDRSLLPRFKRTAAFVEQDYETLERLVSKAVRLVTTPNVCTEVCNFAGQLSEPARSRVLAGCALGISAADEHYFATATCMLEPTFLRLELADTTMLMLSRGGYGVITIDAGLHTELITEGATTLNFNHLRTWLLQ